MKKKPHWNTKRTPSYAKRDNWLKEDEHAPFYSSVAWLRTRDAYRAKNPLCEKCSQPMYYVDHIVPISQGGAKHDFNNLQSLCKSCNAKKTAGQKTNSYNGRRIK